MTGVSPRDTLGSSDIHERFRVRPLLLHVERIQFRRGGVSGMPIREEIPGPTKAKLERLYLLAGLGTSWCPNERS